MYFHLTARVGGVVLTQVGIAAVVWGSFRRAFPEALAVVLMPNHPHLIVSARDGATARHRLSAALSGITRYCRRRPDLGDPHWAVAPIKDPIPDRRHLAREIRYVLLNPCRAGLVADPLEWLWTTHRDVVGAVLDPWVTAPHLAAALGRPRAKFVQEHHAYVSGDPSVCVAGTPLPRRAVATAPTSVGLSQVLAAALAAPRASAEDLQRRSLTRRLFVQLAAEHGWNRPVMLARMCRVARQSVHRLLGVPLDRAVLDPATLCLGDERLMRPYLPRQSAPQ
ncbi:MAG: hypothetical protein HY906_12380 [Deltaproteobacteria bacterium]|nr:hypothetical protein [Deltaproteobacteria bacterium]